MLFCFFFFQAEDGIRDTSVTGVQTCALPICTCDQLYFALRVASLEHYFDAHEPMPFIVDDVLLSFDDERASSALSVLNGMSAKTQVVFFTHHQHLVNLAESATQAAVMKI